MYTISSTFQHFRNVFSRNVFEKQTPIEFTRQILTLQELLKIYHLTQFLPSLEMYGITIADDIFLADQTIIDSIRAQLKLLPKKRFNSLLLDTKAGIIEKGS
jgi:hypothetical protein